MREKILLAVMTLGAITTACLAEETPPPQASAAPVALVEGQPITASELEAAAGSKLTSLQQQVYDVRSQALNELIFNKLVAVEAAKEGIAVAQYYAKHVTDEVKPPSAEEVQQVLDRYRSRLPADDEMARAQVIEFLTTQARQEREKTFREELFARHDIRVLLEPPRIVVELLATDATRGPANAPVTIVEFSDFQCPFCSKIQPVLTELDTAYGEKLRWVFKHLPLPMHPNARFAAQAAVCAQQQGAFWPLHDWMFANQNTLTRDAITAEASELKLNLEAFGACLDDPASTRAIELDMAAANALGINGTPAYVVNGRLVVGAQPLATFRQIIDDELRRATPAAE